MKTTRRGEIRAIDPDGTDDGTVEVLAVAYGIVDDYGSLWAPGVFQRSLAERMPTFAFGHSWSDPIGRAIGQRDSDEGQWVTMRLDLDEAVPRALQAHAQMKSGTLDDVSVGFSNVTRREPTDDERRDYPGVLEVIEDADLDEVSVVLRGAVPGAKVMAVRAANGTVAVDAVVEIAKRKVAGEITEGEADEALRLLAVDSQEAMQQPHDGDEQELPEAITDAEKLADAALEASTGRSRR